MKKLMLVVLIMCSSCMTFKKVENYYMIKGSGDINIEDSDQRVSGSDAEDSLNGNTPSVTFPVIP